MYPCKPQFYYIKVGFNGVKIIQACFHDAWFNVQAKLLPGAESNDAEFWRSVGRVGVAHFRNSPIPMEVVLDKGRVDTELEAAL